MTGSAAGERTSLAWQRTALAIVAASAFMARLTWSVLGGVATLVFLVAVVLSAWVFATSWLRYSRSRVREGPALSRGGLTPLLLAVAVTTICAAELVALVLGGHGSA